MVGNLGIVLRQARQQRQLQRAWIALFTEECKDEGESRVKRIENRISKQISNPRADYIIYSRVRTNGFWFSVGTLRTTTKRRNEIMMMNRSSWRDGYALFNLVTLQTNPKVIFVLVRCASFNGARHLLFDRTAPTCLSKHIFVSLNSQSHLKWVYQRCVDWNILPEVDVVCNDWYIHE